MQTLIAVFLLAAVVFWVRKANPGRKQRNQRDRSNETNESSHQYRDKKRLLNKSELTLYNTLREAVPGLLVFSQVSLSQVLDIDSSTREGYRQLSETGRKSLDFVVCRTKDTSIVAAIELNGPTHRGKKQIESDNKKKTALEQAGIPLLILEPGYLPDALALRKQLALHVVKRKHYENERDKTVQS